MEDGKGKKKGRGGMGVRWGGGVSAGNCLESNLAVMPPPLNGAFMIQLFYLRVRNRVEKFFLAGLGKGLQAPPSGANTLSAPDKEVRLGRALILLKLFSYLSLAFERLP